MFDLSFGGGAGGLTIASVIYFLVAILSIAHLFYYLSQLFIFGRYSAAPEGVKGVKIFLEDKIKFLSLQSGLGLVAILVIAINNAWLAISGEVNNVWIGSALKLLFGVGVEKGYILRLGFLGFYWGLVIVASIILSEKAKSQLQLLWVLRDEIKLEMPGYDIKGQRMGIKGLVISIVVIIALLAFLVLFPYLF